MNLLKLGRRTLNLDYLIMVEECESPPAEGPAAPDTLRVTLLTGTSFGLGGVEADALRQRLGELAPDPAPAAPLPGSVAVGVNVDPKTGGLIPRAAKLRKERG